MINDQTMKILVEDPEEVCRAEEELIEKLEYQRAREAQMAGEAEARKKRASNIIARLAGAPEPMTPQQLLQTATQQLRGVANCLNAIGSIPALDTSNGAPLNVPLPADKRGTQAVP